MRKRIQRIQKDLARLDRDRVKEDASHLSAINRLDARESDLRAELAEAQRHAEGLATLKELLA